MSPLALRAILVVLSAATAVVTALVNGKDPAGALASINWADLLTFLGSAASGVFAGWAFLKRPGDATKKQVEKTVEQAVARASGMPPPP